MAWVGIFGTRDWESISCVRAVVDALDLDDVVVSGGGGRVDKWAEQIARDRGLATLIIPAQWRRHDYAAGPIRNGRCIEILAQHQGRAVMFWDGASRGTADTIRKAYAAGLPVEVIGPLGVAEKAEALRPKPRPPGLFDDQGAP